MTDQEIKIARDRLSRMSIERIVAVYQDRRASLVERIAAEQIINLHFAP